MRSIYLFLAFLILLSTQACFLEDLEDLESPEYKPSFAIPLINSTLNLEDILEEFEDVSTIYIDADGLIHFVYRGDILTREAEEVFSEVRSIIPPVIPMIRNPLEAPVTTPDGLSIDRLDIKNGRFIYYLENPDTEPITVQFSFPALSKEGASFEFEVEIPGYSGSGDRPAATNQDDPIFLKGYSIIPQNDSVSISYVATTSSGQPVIPANFIIQLQELDFSYAGGYLGQTVFEGGQDEIEIDFFDQYIDGSIYFAEPKVTFLLENSFGVPVRSIVNSFDIFTVDGQVLQVESPLVESGIDFAFPSLNQVGQVEKSSIVFDKNNSNVDVLLGAGPIRIAYDVDGLTNPENDPATKGFVTDSSYFRVQMEVDLPLFGTAMDFAAADTIATTFGDFKDVNEAEFKIVSDNALPLDIAIQAYFIDADRQVIDSLLPASERLIRAATVDDQGVASDTITTTTFVTFGPERLGPVKKAEKIILLAKFSTDADTGRPVKIFNSQAVNVRIGAILNIKTE